MTSCIAQGTLLSVMWQPGWEGNLGENGYMYVCVADAKSLHSCVRLCATPWTAAHQASLSMGFSRQEHWSGLPFPSPMHESEK